MGLKQRLLNNDFLLNDYDLYLEQCEKKTVKRYFVFVFLFFYHNLLKKNSLYFCHVKNIKLERQECNLYIRESIDSLVEKLTQYDVISFDIFDTLIFRPVEKPVQCFSLLELKNRLLSFSRYRRLAEVSARKKSLNNNGEINIFDIYRELSNYYFVKDTEAFALEEIQFEKEICYANPYMFDVYTRLRKSGKKVIAVSDMYIPEIHMKQILSKCGYDIENVFVSCDYGISKKTGELQKLVHKKLGMEKKIIHIDDNINCLKGCKKAKWNTYYYEQCNKIGSPYRNTSDNTPAAFMYNGIINNYLHCGSYNLCPEEELGFVYAGIAVCGYDEWLQDFCRKNECEKVLFLARDMDIFYRVFNMYYDDIPNEYVSVSRSALRELYFEHCPADFLEFVIKSRIDLGKTIEDVLEESDLKFLCDYAEKEKINIKDFYTQNNEKEINTFILKYANEIIKKFTENEGIVKNYFIEKIGKAKNICIAGLGWRGTEIAYLKWLIEEKWGISVNIYGTLFGTDNSEDSINNMLSYKITPYAFSSCINRNLSFLKTKRKIISVMILESIFTSKEPSLVKYGNNNGEIEFICKKNNPNLEIISHIQDGILLFVKEYEKKRKLFNFTISAIDAYTPLFKLLDNYKYILNSLGNFVEKPRCVSGLGKDDDYIAMKDLL